MNPTESVATQIHYYFYPHNSPHLRLYALAYFAFLIALGTILGKAFLGFEQSWAQTTAAVGSAICTQLLLDAVDSIAYERKPRYRGNVADIAGVVLPAWITGFSVSILIYPSGLIWPMIFAAVVSVSSKFMLRVPLAGSSLHCFNPSNFGIAVTLIVLPWVGVAPPYHFTENVAQLGNWLIPALILASGITLHATVTKRLPICMAWLGGFGAQALIRAWMADLTVLPFLVPATGAAFVLFTLYMLPDPATTPLLAKRQVLFGLTVAATYGVFQTMHIVYGLFFSLFLVCGLRGTGLLLLGLTNAAWIREAATTVKRSPSVVSKHISEAI